MATIIFGEIWLWLYSYNGNDNGPLVILNVACWKLPAPNGGLYWEHHPTRNLSLPRLMTPEGTSQLLSQ